jgi:hypothetical protein
MHNSNSIDEPTQPFPPPLRAAPPPTEAWPPKSETVAALEAHYLPVSVNPTRPPPRLRHPDALRLLDDCERLGVSVLGMDFFHLVDGGIRPCHTVDFTAGESYPDILQLSVQLSRESIGNKFPEGADVVEFVLHA